MARIKNDPRVKRDYSLKTQITSSYFHEGWLRPYNPAELFQKFGGLKVFDEMREDDQIAALLNLKKSLCVQSGWDIVCEENNDAAEFVEWNLEDIDFSKCLYDILTAFDYGFSITEKNFARRETAWGENICLDALCTRPPHGFLIRQADTGEIDSITQQGTAIGDIDVPLNKVLIYSHNQEFGGPYGRSELNRGVYTAWWAKKALYKFWGMYLERFGMPTVSLSYDPQATNDDEKSTAQDIIKNMQAATGVLLPSSIKAEFIQAASAGDGFKLAIDQYNLAIARKMGIPDLLGMSGEKTQGGSYALGTTQIQTFYATLGKPRRELEQLITREIVTPLVEMNFGPDLGCRFVFKPISEDDKIERAKVLITAVQAGAVKADDAIGNLFREFVGLPEVETVPAAPPPAPTPEQPASQPQPDAQPVPEAPEVDAEEEMARVYAKFEPLGQYDKRVKYAAIDNYLETQAQKTKQALSDIIQESVDKLMAEVRRKNLLGKADAAAVNDLDLKGWNAFAVTLKSSMRDSVQEAKAGAADEIDKKLYAEGWTTPDLNDWINATAQSAASSTKEKLLNKIKLVILNAMQAGEGIAQITQDVNTALEDYSASYTANQLETIVRTNVNSAYNQSRIQFFQDQGADITAYQFSAVMDGRTSERCSELNGAIIKPNEANKYNPPMHYNCRSVLVPITAAEAPPDFTDMTDLSQVPPGAFK